MLNINLLTKLLVLLTTTIFFISCEKNDHHPNPNPNPATKKVWKIKTNDNDSTLFAYTTTGQLHKVITTEEGIGDDVVTYTFLYDPAYKITEINSSGGLRYKFLYEAGRLKFTENFVGANKVSENYFEYTNNRLSSIGLFTPFPANGVVTYKPTLKTSYSYDMAGQLRKVTSYLVDHNTNGLTKINEKEVNLYDNNKNPLSVLSTLTMVRIFDMPGEHNIIKETLYGADGQVEETTQNSYVYDNDKYPVTGTSTITPAGGLPVTAHFKYFYK